MVERRHTVNATDDLKRRDQLVSDALDLADDLIDCYSSPLSWLELLTREVWPVPRPPAERITRIASGVARNGFAARGRFIERYWELRKRQQEAAQDAGNPT
jgi:hypothetical protein